MVTLVSDIIRDAYRESNLIAISTEPSGAQRQEALRLLNRLLASVFGNEEGEQLIPLPIGSNGINRPAGFPGYQNVPTTTDWVVPPNVRLVLNVTQATEVWLTPTPMDGARFAITDHSGNLATFPLTIRGNGANVSGAPTSVINTNGVNIEYMYRADRGSWTIVTPIVETDEWPFPPEFDDMFIVGLAMRLNPRSNIATAQESLLIYRRSLSQFRARYRQAGQGNVDLGLLRTRGIMDTLWAFPGASYDSTASFNAGHPLGFNSW